MSTACAVLAKPVTPMLSAHAAVMAREEIVLICINTEYEERTPRDTLSAMPPGTRPRWRRKKHGNDTLLAPVFNVFGFQK